MRGRLAYACLSDSKSSFVTFSSSSPCSSSAGWVVARAVEDDDHEILDAAVQARVERTVVQVFATIRAPDLSRPWTKQAPTEATGTGIVIEGKRILTNAHVVDLTEAGIDAKDAVFLVKMYDGTLREAKVLGKSVDYDIALLQLDDTSDLHPLALADTSALRVGDRVVAVGNALDLGDEPTVSTGIVSALDRTLDVTSTVTLRGIIQTDAAINHGNSGGALVNGAGELIGINSAGIPNAQNVGFAISAGTIAPLLDDLKAGRTINTSSPSFPMPVTSATSPVTSWVIASVVAAAGEVTTLTPIDIASGITLGRPSRSPLGATTPVCRSTSAQASWVQISWCGKWPQKVTWLAMPSLPASCSNAARRGPSPAMRAVNGTPAACSAA